MTHNLFSYLEKNTFQLKVFGMVLGFRAAMNK